MPLFLKIILSVIISYLLGSIPTAYWLGRLKGIDVRQHGSGNVGATNAMRVLGKGPGTLVLFIDILKGVLATALVTEIFGLDQVGYLVLMGLVVVAGHNWTIFLNFKGGKGIATSLGALIGLAIQLASLRPALFITVAVWSCVFLLSGYVSLASMIAAAALPLVLVFTNQPLALISMGIIICIFVAVRHKPNIKRLLSGKENRVQFPFLKKR